MPENYTWTGPEHEAQHFLHYWEAGKPQEAIDAYNRWVHHFSHALCLQTLIAIFMAVRADDQ